MKIKLVIATLVGFSTSVSAHTSESSSGMHLVEHILPVVLFVSSLVIAIKGIAIKGIVIKITSNR